MCHHRFRADEYEKEPTTRKNMQGLSASFFLAKEMGKELGSGTIL
jgi:hypothetical protein